MLSPTRITTKITLMIYSQTVMRIETFSCEQRAPWSVKGKPEHMPQVRQKLIGKAIQTIELQRVCMSVDISISQATNEKNDYKLELDSYADTSVVIVVS